MNAPLVLPVQPSTKNPGLQTSPQAWTVGRWWAFWVGFSFMLAQGGTVMAQVPMQNGERVTSNLTLNTTNRFTFSASVGDYIQFRAGAPFRPLLVVYGPDGKALETGSGSGSSSLDALLQLPITATGEYWVEVSSYYRNAAGQYQLNYARSTGAFLVSAGDEGGELINNVGAPGVIERGDIDLWSFQASAGETFLLRMGSPGYRPYFQVFSPAGKLLGVAQGSGSSDTDAFISIQATNTGTFLVTAQSFYQNNNGPYVLNYVKAPGALNVASGDEGGAMTNGYLHKGEVTLGDLDGWSFNAVAGQTIHVRMGAPLFRPWLHVYGPSGVLVGSNAGSGSSDRDALVTLVTTNSGTYTVVAMSYYNDGVGPYTLNVAQSGSAPTTAVGDEGGELINGAATAGRISAGDMDVWQFTAAKGDGIALRVGSPEFRSWLTLLGPDGRVLVAEQGRSSSDRDSFLYQVATNSGVYTLWVESFYTTGGGDYTVHLARVPAAFVTSPGDEGGMLQGGISQDGTLDLGDQDPWRFVVCQNELVTLRCEKRSGASFTPRLRLWDRSGVLLNTAVQATNAVISFRPKQAGIYTLIVDGASLNQSGSYRLTADGIADGTGLCAPEISGTNAVVRAVGGNAGEGFVLLTQTDVGAPLSQWTPISTNTFDSYGVFSHVYPFSTLEPKRFFFLQLSSDDGQ